ncbi:MAG: hypothetical protein ACJ8AO_00435 [Gemmatimonadaceae bacterium]
MISPLGAALALALLAPRQEPRPAYSPSVPSARRVAPTLAFPEAGLDDTAKYRGYQARLFRDGTNNTVQIYLDEREGRVVAVLADAENASVGFSARAAAAEAPGPAPVVPLRWASPDARVSRAGRARVLEYDLAADAPAVRLGHFLLGSMRVERDFQYWKKHREPFAAPPFVLEEWQRLAAALGRLAPAERARHLALLHAGSEAALRARFTPSLVLARGAATVVQPSLDGRDTMRLVVRPAANATLVREGSAVTVRSRDGGPVRFTVAFSTTGRALTPLARREIFTPEFLAWADAAGRDATDAPARRRARLLERQVRAVELLSSHEKLMAGMPTYATYFGRDMLVSALMMRPIWRTEMSEFAIGAALRKLSPTGQVSHEEALGGQAVREAASEYAALVDAWGRARDAGDRAGADTLLARARRVLRDARRTRENYHMIDDELQLPVLVARWLGPLAELDAERAVAFLRGTEGGVPRYRLLLRELALVARMTEPYARDARPEHLISFERRDDGRWGSASWRDSGAGYGNGRFAMDVNAIWAPRALEAVEQILFNLLRIDMPAAAAPEAAPDTPLGRWARDPAALRAAIETWRGAERHFVVRLSPDQVRSQVGARLAAMPDVERAHWQGVLAATGADRDSLEFLALALDAEGRPLPVLNTDPATGLFLSARFARSEPQDDAPERERVLRDVRTFLRAYPVGLLVDRVGPVVANDAYASRQVWEQFREDPYHGPRVVWGREVNLFLIGVAGHFVTGAEDPAYRRELRAAADSVQAAVRASGFGSELWSYDFVNGRPVAVRYGSAGDIQLWSTTELAVQYLLERMR